MIQAPTETAIRDSLESETEPLQKDSPDAHLQWHIRSRYGMGVAESLGQDEPPTTLEASSDTSKDSRTPVDIIGEALLDIPADAYRLSRSDRHVFITSKKWIGTVVSIGGNSFYARLIDLSGEAPVEEEAEFPIADVNSDDSSLLHEGAEFYFSVGYFFSERGNRQRSSRIRFRRFPNWSPDEIVDAYKKAKEIERRIQFE